MTLSPFAIVHFDRLHNNQSKEMRMRCNSNAYVLSFPRHRDKIKQGKRPRLDDLYLTRGQHISENGLSALGWLMWRVK